MVLVPYIAQTGLLTLSYLMIYRRAQVLPRAYDMLHRIHRIQIENRLVWVGSRTVNLFLCQKTYFSQDLDILKIENRRVFNKNAPFRRRFSFVFVPKSYTNLPDQSLNKDSL